MRVGVLLLACGLLFAGTDARAQADPNAHAWVMYFGDHPVGDSKFEAHLEAQWRRAELGRTWQQLLLRPAVNYRVRRSLLLTGGYGFIETYPYGDFPARERFPEHRTYEQIQIADQALGADWQHRLRLEQRHILGYAARYENRFRYMLRAAVPLPWGRRYYLGAYDEIFYNFGANVARNTFDQNRAFVAVGRHLTPQTRLEVGFMEQTVQHRDGRVFEHNHTLQVALHSRTAFGRRR